MPVNDAIACVTIATAAMETARTPTVMDSEETPEIAIYGEFITSLKVANIYIGFKNEVKSYNIRKIVCEPSQIQVSVKRRAGFHWPKLTLADLETVLSLGLPSSVCLLPNTCSSLQPTPYGWLLRLNMNEVATDPGPKKDSGERATAFSPKCRSCGNGILESGMDDSITTCIPLSQLGLPSDMQWDQMDLSYFCHDHNHQHQDESDGTQQLAAFVPKTNEAFVCHAFYVLNASCIKVSTLVSSAEKTGELKCGRCHLTIGKIMSGLGGGDDKPRGAVQLYIDAVEPCGNEKHSLNATLGKFLRESSDKCRRLCIFLKDSVDDAAALLVWIMDWNLKIFKARSSEQTSKMHNQDVCKILYRHETFDSALAKQWLADSNVKRVAVHQSLLFNLISALLKSTDSLPLAWRYANDFCVGYLETCP